jgi:hypothetical protein
LVVVYDEEPVAARFVGSVGSAGVAAVRAEVPQAQHVRLTPVRSLLIIEIVVTLLLV